MGFYVVLTQKLKCKFTLDRNFEAGLNVFELLLCAFDANLGAVELSEIILILNIIYIFLKK
jgi:hypothetical protein